MDERSVVSPFFYSPHNFGFGFLSGFLKADVDQKTICCLLVIRALLVFRPIPG